MANLSIKYAGIEFKNPVVASSGPLGRTFTSLTRSIESGVSAVTLKSTASEPPEELKSHWAPGGLIQPRPAHKFLRKHGAPKIMYNWEGAPPTFTADMQSKLIKKIKPIANEYNCKIIASLDVCPTYINNHDIYRSDLEKILEAGPDLLEQTPCPYGHSTPIPFNIEKVEEIHYIAKEEAGIPTIMASAWELLGMRINEYKKHGIKHIHMKSAFFGTAIDIETMKPIVPGPFVMTYGSLRRFGQNLAVAQAKNADFELICSGGVWTAYDCLEKLMCGASLVAIHTAIQYHGHKLFTEIIKGISEYLDRKNCVISDIIGTAVNDIIDVKMHDEFARQHDVPARDLEINIDITRCTSCGLCENCIHGGITIHNDVPIWKNEFCERCGICESICPTEAITITKLGDKNEI